MPVWNWIRRRVAKTRAWIQWIRAPERLKRQVAVHEAGHALAAWLLPTFRAVERVTVMPEGDFRGYTLATHSLGSPPKMEEIEHLMTMGMAGAAAERILLDECDGGSTDDMIHVLAWWLSFRYGMSCRASLGTAAALFRRMTRGDPSERFAAQMYALPTLAFAASLADDLLVRHALELAKLARALRRHRTLDHRGLEKILGPRPA